MSPLRLTNQSQPDFKEGWRTNMDRRSPVLTPIELLDQETAGYMGDLCNAPCPDDGELLICQRIPDHESVGVILRESHAAKVNGNWVTWNQLS